MLPSSWSSPRYVWIIEKNSVTFIHSFILSVVRLTTGPHSFPKRVLHTVQSTASSFSFQYPFFSLCSANSCLRLLPRLPVTSVLPSIFPSIPCYVESVINTTHQSITLHFISIQLSTVFCQGDMFRPYKIIIRPSKKADQRAAVCFTALWDPKCLQVFVTECKST